MKRLPVLASFLLSFQIFAAEPVVHHDIKVVLSPQGHSLKVEDRFEVPSNRGRENTFRFTLHEGLNPVIRSAGAELRQVSGTSEETPPTSVYEVAIDAGVASVTLAYEGEIHHPLNPPTEEYARSFGETPGIISEEGVYLSNASAWLPRMGGELVTFTMDLRLPDGWDGVSQGERLLHERAAGQLTRVVWASREPQDEVYLVGAPFIEYSRVEPGLEIYAFLRTPDPALANQYIEVTGRYIQMYNDLVGKYAYGKFALVENFWETGYGMPSFTLLGPKIIRFPFIINSSYPHEILHNWWGNGVFVNYAGGNWCEGITAYLADHLIKEQQGSGVAYRRETLQKYTDFSTEQNDFPLSRFQERYNSITEAIGYGKSLMYQHMLRTELGDELYRKGIAAFYAEYKFRHASFTDLATVLGRVAGKDLSPRHRQWVERAGAPELRVVSATALETGGGGFLLRAVLEQVQPGAAYELDIPLAVQLVGAPEAFQTRVHMDSLRQEFLLTVPGRPFRLEVDPEYDLFRRLNRYEIPPSLSQDFGAKKTLIVLPSQAGADELERYRALAREWSGGADAGEFEVRLDAEVQASGGIPSDRAVWILGWNTAFRDLMKDGLKDYDLSIGDENFRVGPAEFTKVGHSLVVSVRHPRNPAMTISWVAANPGEAIAGLARKLPHYGKYSYLVFKGAEPTNVAKGIWPAVHSPMVVPVIQPDGTVLNATPGQLRPRKALAPEVGPFSSTRMKDSVQLLSSDRFKGRELGSPELDAVAQLLADRFRAAGLQPGGAGDFFQTWTQQLAAPKGAVQLRNIVGFIPGKSPELAGQSVVIGAHYDHLGLGWPDSHAGNAGQVHPGADDNASGVSVVLELARYYGAKAQDGVLPERSILFVLFTGEEAGLLGSGYFAATGVPGRYDPSGFFAMINLDTVGRLQNNKLTVFGTGSAREWGQILGGVGYVTGVPIQTVANDCGCSDHVRFFSRGVPAIDFFTGASADYHRPSDTADKIDADGLVKVARVAQETLDYLASRKEPLSSTPGPGPGPSPDPGSERKVYLGTLPDFTFAGDGVRIDSVQPDSPAEKAGLRSGDIIVRMNDASIRTLKEYSVFLKSLHGGDRVKIFFLRDGNALETLATVIER